MGNGAYLGAHQSMNKDQRCWWTIRVREIAQQHFGGVDKGYWENMFCSLELEFEQTTTCNTARAMREPLSDVQQDRLGPRTASVSVRPVAFGECV